MQKIFFLLTLLNCSSIIAQSNLEVHFKDCRQEKRLFGYHDFNVFKADTLYLAVKNNHNSIKTLNNLPYGTYRIEYKTIFNQTAAVQIKLLAHKTYYVDLCINFLDHQSDPYQPMIDQLKDNETYQIKINSSGCEHNTTEIITVIKRAGVYYLSLNKKEQLLSSQAITAIRQFEIELNHMTSMRCTTIDTYTITSHETVITITDGSCTWNGFYHLKIALGLK